MSCLRLNNNRHSQAIVIDSNVLKKVKSRVKMKFSAPTRRGESNQEKNPAALTTALVWSEVSDAMLVSVHADSSHKSGLEIYKHC